MRNILQSEFQKNLRKGNKGTGKWTSESALDLGVPLPLITESVFARYISTYKDER
ncbi:6-phosphogluconate dehydrogenase (decarboxylating), gnd, partial [Lactococcus cremoris]